MNEAQGIHRHFSWKRLGHLARKTLSERWRGTAVAAAVVGGVLILQGGLPLLLKKSHGTDYSVYLIIAMLIWGSIEASSAFPDLHKKPKNEMFLLLPASALEKTLVPLLYVSLLIPVAIFATVYLGSVITEGLTVLVLPGEGFRPLRLWQEGWLRLIGYTVIMQSLFFLGGAWFRRSCWWKTVLSLVVLGIALMILTGGLMWIFFGSIINDMPFYDYDFSQLKLNWPAFARAAEILGRILVFGILPPFCWIVAWFRVKEAQSSDGI